VNWLLTIVIVLAVLLAVAWAGLKVPPPRFPPLAETPDVPAAAPLPDGLPAPVERFYREIYGDRLPRIETAVLSGRATLRIAGVPLPARWRFVHDVGEAYRHEIVTTWFGLPLLRVDERFVDGQGRMRLPFGTEQGPAVDQGANLALWAEALWFPAALALDPRVRWDPVDDATALLRVPFGEERETFVARFDASTGLLATLEAMRYKGADAAEKTLWLNHAERWGRIAGQPTVTEAAVRWVDDPRPWAAFHLEQLVLNVDDVDRRLRE
jgi:hypothetical protein